MKKKHGLAPYAYLFFSMLFIIGFIYYPAIKTMFKSLYLVNAENHPVAFVGLANYRTLFSDPEFRGAVRVTFQYALCSVPLTIVIAYALALVSARKRRLSRLYELLYALPMAVSMSVACVIFRILFNGNLGLIRPCLKNSEE